MIGENRPLVTNEPVEVEDCRNISDHFGGIYRIYSNLTKETRRMSTCNRLDLQTLGSQPVIVPKNLPDHCIGIIAAAQAQHVDHYCNLSQEYPHHYCNRVQYYYLISTLYSSRCGVPARARIWENSLHIISIFLM